MIFLESEMLVGSEIVNPNLFRPRSFLGRLSVEEKHVRLHPLCVEDAGGQAQKGMYVCLLEQLAANCFTRAAFKQHVVRHHDRGPAMLFENCKNMLKKV